MAIISSSARYSEEALVFVKPHLLWRRDDLFNYLDDRLFEQGIDFSRTAGELIMPVPLDLIAEHYAHLSPKYQAAYDDVLRTFPKGGICVRGYTGEYNLISAIRQIIGDTDPAKAKIGAIRQVFCSDSIAKAIEESRSVNNGAHASGNPREGKIEVTRFAPLLGQLLYIPIHEERHVRSRIKSSSRRF